MLPGNDVTIEMLDILARTSSKDEFLFEIQEILSRAQHEVEELQPQCSACGNCCKFDSAGHRLFASTGELALLKELEPKAHKLYLRCPWQVENKCFAREKRPLGCRMYFCDNDLSDRIHEIYEKYHSEIVNVHRKWGVGYHYCEMTTIAWEMHARSAE